ncbi:DUF3971 domain-containing protein [Ahrensia sp. 13_GOM-1096m]|uniref:YhdP family protein n=1 Tax=Ahrensia sp. 13_GOM-1096m TaxID=1380380 RepID=UPI0012DD7A82|nr:DUF3971 domain-containing protein [Ahrensia sp. 13_GOM-1096m]
MNEKTDNNIRKMRGGADKPLHELPSFDGAKGPVHAPIMAPRRVLARRCLIGFCVFILVAIAALILVVRSGVVLPVVENAAADALRRVVPVTMDAEVGDTDVAVLWSNGLGITFKDVKLTRKSDQQLMLSADELTVGIRTRSLISGRPEFSSVRLRGATLDVSKSEFGETPQLKISDAHDKFEAIFAAMDNGVGGLISQEGGMRLRADNVKVVLRDNPYSNRIDVVTLSMKAESGQADFDGQFVIDGYDVPVKGKLVLPRLIDTISDDGSVGDTQELSVEATNMPLPWRRFQTMFSKMDEDRVPDKRHEPMRGRASLHFVNAHEVASDMASIEAYPENISFKLDHDDYVPIEGALRLSADFASDAITLHTAPWLVGRTTLDLSGRFRDQPDATEKNVYQFEMLANNGVAYASDANEEPVKFAARAQGSFLLSEQIISFTRLDINSDSGTMNGEGELALEEEYPTAIFTVFADDMSVAGVKQLWPAPVARGARRWALENLAGGRVVKARFDIIEPLKRRITGTLLEHSGETSVELDVEGVEFSVVGDIPPVRNASGHLSSADGVTTVKIDKGSLYLPSGLETNVSDATLVLTLPDGTDGRIDANLKMNMTGVSRAIGELVALKPIDATRFYKFKPADLLGDVDANVTVDFVLGEGPNTPAPDWSVDLKVANAGSKAKIEGRNLSSLDGRIQIDPTRGDFDLKGNIDGLPADIAMVLPFNNSGVKAKRDISLVLKDADRKKLAPGLDELLTGTTPVKFGGGSGSRVNIDLTASKLSLPWIGWAKGSGIKANAVFDLAQNGGATALKNFDLKGASFGARGDIDIDKNGLQRARFGFLQLNKDDNIALDVKRSGKGYSVAMSGKSLDARGIMRHIRAEAQRTETSEGAIPVDITADIKRVTGFHGEYLTNMKLSMMVRGGTVSQLSIRGNTKSGFPVFLNLDGVGSSRKIKLEALGAGEFLRFADIYTNVRGGTLNLSLNGTGPRTLSGKADLFDFRVFNEPKLATLVSSKANGSQSLEQAVDRKIDTQEIKFERASGDLIFSPGRLDISKAVARGPLAGFVIDGKVFDSKNQTRLTGTFMPAYGLNRLFAEIPVLGLFLGNGRDRGLIGVTFKLSGSFDSPQVTVNPLSIIAPGIFRSIFEFR